MVRGGSNGVGDSPRADVRRATTHAAGEDRDASYTDHFHSLMTPVPGACPGGCS